MTTGFITPDQEPALRLEVVGPEGARSFDAIIDTGFNGGLALPPDWTRPLICPEPGTNRWCWRTEVSPAPICTTDT